MQSLFISADLKDRYWGNRRVSKSDRTEKIVMDRAKQFLGYARVHRKELNPFFKRFCQCVSVGDGIKLLEDEIKALESETDENMIELKQEFQDL